MSRSSSLYRSSRAAPLRLAAPRPTTWLYVAAGTSAAALAAVHLLQAMGWPPCELCLHEREVLWTTLALAAAGRAAAVRLPLAPRVACAALAVGFAVGAALAAYHAGVEWRWWPGPEACTAPAGHARLAAADIDAVFSGRRAVHIVRCDQAAFRVAGLSLAGWNALLSAALTAGSLAALTSRTRA